MGGDDRTARHVKVLRLSLRGINKSAIKRLNIALVSHLGKLLRK